MTRPCDLSEEDVLDKGISVDGVLNELERDGIDSLDSSFGTSAGFAVSVTLAGCC